MALRDHLPLRPCSYGLLIWGSLVRGRYNRDRVPKIIALILARRFIPYTYPYTYTSTTSSYRLRASALHLPLLAHAVSHVSVGSTTQV